MDSHIFISYSTQDRDIAFKIVHYLESNGHPCWIAPRNITSGMDYTDVINESIEHCSALVLVFSEHSVKSQFVKKELTTAVSYNKTILPFKISQVELKGGFLFMLNNVQWIEATSRPESHFPEIIAGLEGRGVFIDPGSDPGTSSTEGGAKKKRWLIIVAIGALLAAAIILLLLLRPAAQPQTPDSLAPTPDFQLPDTLTNPAADTLTAEPVESPTTPVTTPTNKTKNSDNKEAREKRTSAQTSTAQVANEATVVKEPEVETPVVEKPEQPTPKTVTNNDKAAKMGKARRYLNNKKYKAALAIFEELKQENPNDKALDALIEECRRHL